MIVKNHIGIGKSVNLYELCARTQVSLHISSNWCGTVCSVGSRDRKAGIEPNQIEDYAVAEGHTKVTVRKHLASNFLRYDLLGVA